MKNIGNATQCHLLIELAGETYAINVTNVYQIFEVTAITKVPQMPPFMLGVTNARGRMLPVIDLRVLFGIEASKLTKQSSIIAASGSFGNDPNEGAVDVGLLVDGVLEVTEMDESAIERPSLPGQVDNYSCLSGFVRLGEKIIMILDVENLLNIDGIAEIKSFLSEKASA